MNNYKTVNIIVLHVPFGGIRKKTSLLQWIVVQSKLTIMQKAKFDIYLSSWRFWTCKKKRKLDVVYILSNLVVTLLVRLWVLNLCRHRLPSALPDLRVFFYYRYRLSGLFPNLPVFCHQNRFLRFQPIWLFLRQYTSADNSIHRIIRDVIYLWFTKVLCIFKSLA